MSEPNSPGESRRGAPRFFVGCEDDESEALDESIRRDMELYDDDEDTDSPPEQQIVVGICCMMKKSKSKPMTQILERLCRFEYITVVIFPEDVILNEPVDKWPLCDCLISFHSKGFPLDKAVSYAKLRNPLLINDLNMQYYIQDRREVYRILQEEGIDLPRYAVLNRDPDKPDECNLVEGEDHVEVNGEIFQKPFVEKPVCAEDHNVYIYYPTSAGGGSQRLFRKIGSRSSVYSPESSVRKTGSYIYEEFMPTDGTDVKVYTVGPDYAHAEARKSPALDGKVERDSEGKEVRYPVMLSAMEKLVARKVCLAFKQTVCGFDLLRANGHSYVCDVNGFSFVKNSMKYYDDCAKILGNIVMRELAPQFQIPWSIPTEAEDIPIVPTTSGTMMELRCVIAVIRHGDRTPKQKMKMEVRNPIRIKDFLRRIQNRQIKAQEAETTAGKNKRELYGHFSGINRKVQLTYLPHGQPKTSSEEEDTRKEGPSLLLVLKWGGELTPAGRVQAEELGRAFRCMYPGGQGDYAGFPGCGLLRLHSTYRHDLKIYASDEGRVQMTAAAFAKGLLALEGELTPILVQMVKSANMNGLLDSDSDSLSSCQHRVKARLHEILQKDREFTEEDYDRLAPTCAASLVNSMRIVQNPVERCDQVYALIQSLTSQIRKRMEDPKSADLQLYHSESLELMLQRWSKLERDFRMKNGRYDISKIPDIYDCVKYDVIHNATLGLEDTLELFRLSRALADVVIPQEYGINTAEKLDIAYAYCLPLVRKIQLDLQRTHEDESVNKLHPLYSRGVMSPGRHVRTRLYFTSESHVHSLLSIFRYGGLLDEEKDQQWKRAMDYLSAVSELNYMTQIVIMLYEDNNKDLTSEERFHVELHFSPGVKGVEEEENAPTGFGFRPASAENGQKQPEPGSLEDLSRDETDRAVPLSEPITIQRRSPLIRNHKTGSMEVRLTEIQCINHLSEPRSCVFFLKVLSETSSSKVGSYRLFSFCSRQSPEMKQSGLGSQCAGLFSTTVLGGSSSAPNLQDYARAHRKKFSSGSLSYKDGFEGCSMVPSIYPLETLHNSLSLKQVNEFLTSVCESAGDPKFKIMNTIQSPVCLFCVPADSSGPSSTVSSAGPSSPTTADTSPRFSFSDKISLTPQSSEETHSSQNTSAQPAPTAAGPQVIDAAGPAGSNQSEVPLTPKNSPEDDNGSDQQPDNPDPVVPGQEVAAAAAAAAAPTSEDPSSAFCDPCLRPPCSALAELSLSRLEGYCLPGSLPVLLELRESSSEAGSSSQTPQSPEGPDEFFDTQESMELWMDSPESPCAETPPEGGSAHTAEP
uniref:Inositol hexakisphosphate and diphosphoinositol-pentakisphosphate kinase n=1 Tax=Salarias fasciatus TaxID=181472 RepID=A0A672F3J7_SALFA